MSDEQKKKGLRSIVNKSMAYILREHGKNFLAIPKEVRERYHVESAENMLCDQGCISDLDPHIVTTKPFIPDKDWE